MICIFSRHACFDGGLVDTYQIPSIQNVVYSDKYQSKEGKKGFTRKEECLFCLAYTGKLNHEQNWGSFMHQREGTLVSFLKSVLNFQFPRNNKNMTCTFI